MQAALQQGSPQAVPSLFKTLLDSELLPDAVSFTCLITAFSNLSRHEDAVRPCSQASKHLHCKPCLWCCCHAAVCQELQSVLRLDSSWQALSPQCCMAAQVQGSSAGAGLS